MFCLNDCFTRRPSLRVRAVPELERCLVFTPERPQLHTLNASAWLVFELCDGRTLAGIEAAYRDAIGAGPEQAVAPELHAIVGELTGRGIVSRSAAQPEPTTSA